MEDLVAEKRIKTVVSLLAKNEKLRRLYLAAEAESLGWGGMVYVSKIAGVDKDTVTAGKKDLEKLRQNHETQCSDSIDDSESPIKERIRAEGGGRKSIVDTQPGIIEALLKLIDGSEYGNPENPLSYTSKSTRHLATELTKQGFTVSHTKVKELLEEQGYSLQGNRKLKQVGKDHEDRNEQFEHIKRTSMEYMSAGEPVISIDCKKKENLGDFANKGVEYRKVKDPKAVLDHDFSTLRTAKLFHMVRMMLPITKVMLMLGYLMILPSLLLVQYIPGGFTWERIDIQMQRKFTSLQMEAVVTVAETDYGK